MPRPPRLTIPGIPQHIVQRGNNRQVCFYKEKDYALYLSKLGEFAEKFQVAIHSFVLMTNHVHLLLTPKTEQGTSLLMQWLGRSYVRYVNQTYGRTGTLWEGRFKSSIIDSERYFLTVSRYIELNPIRAGMVENPVDYTWSSYQSNAVGKPIKLLKQHDCYLALGNTKRDREAIYRALFENEIPETTIKEIRNATKRAWILGQEGFIQQITKLTGRQVPLEVGGDRKSCEFKQRRL